MATATPVTPKATPASLRPVSFSSAKAMAAITTPKTAVKELKIAVSPLSICSCPQARKKKGRTLFSTPITRKAPQTRGSLGIALPDSKTAAQSTSIAQKQRCSTAVNGPISSSAMRVDRKDPPQISARRRSCAQATPDMDFCCVMGASASRTPGQATRNMCNHARVSPLMLA